MGKDYHYPMARCFIGFLILTQLFKNTNRWNPSFLWVFVWMTKRKKVRRGVCQSCLAVLVVGKRELILPCRGRGERATKRLWIFKILVGMPGFEPGVTRTRIVYVSRYTTSRYYSILASCLCRRFKESDRFARVLSGWDCPLAFLGRVYLNIEVFKIKDLSLLVRSFVSLKKGFVFAKIRV